VRDVSGLASLLRASIANLAGVDPSRVVITALVGGLSPNASSALAGLMPNSSLALNASVLGNNGTEVDVNNTAVWGTPAPPVRRRLDASLDPSGACVAARALPANATHVSVWMSMDATGLVAGDGSSFAAAAAYSMRIIITDSGALVEFFAGWVNCTGGEAATALSSVLLAPTVVLAPSPWPSPSAPALDAPAAGGGDAARLSAGALAAIIVCSILGGCGCCLATGLALRRRQRGCELEAEGAPPAAEASALLAAWTDAGLPAPLGVCPLRAAEAGGRADLVRFTFENPELVERIRRDAAKGALPTLFVATTPGLRGAASVLSILPEGPRGRGAVHKPQAELSF